MYLFLDDESDCIEAELDKDTVSTKEHHRKQNFISIRWKIEIAEAAVRGKPPWVYPLWSGMGKQHTGQSNSTLHQIIARTEKAGAQERGELNKALW